MTRLDPLAVARSVIAVPVEQLDTATTPGEALRRVLAIEQAAATARERLAVALVLDEGWSYAELGRALRITRQAATKTYGPLVQATSHRRIRAR